MPGRVLADHDRAATYVPKIETRSPIKTMSNANAAITATSPMRHARMDDRPAPAPNGVTARKADSNDPSGSTTATTKRDLTLSNGLYPPTKTSDSIIPVDLQAGLDALPPEITHITANYHSYSKLLDRVTQECFNGLQETVNELASLADEGPHVNGNSATPISASPRGAEKRLRWLDFASNHRERFVKLLVLLQWSQRVEDVGRIIDLVAWMHNQSSVFEHVEEALGLLKRDFHAAKLPNPDFKTAVETLSTGRSTRMPDLEYIPPPAPTPAKTLKDLRTLNIQLHLRLNLSEDLPKPLQNFSIASGRVTFTVPAEFEVDLSIADADPTSQFYFIDFRFLCFQRSEIPTDQLRNHFELRINSILASEGLIGCYNFLHNFVLTHKINTLRQQAVGLARNFWAGSLYVQYLHRVLVIQYWKDRPGKKSWVEIGVGSGRGTPGYKPETSSHLILKWVRAGKEVKDARFMSLTSAELNMEDILRNIIALHISSILSEIHKQMLDIFSASKRLARGLKYTTSKRNPNKCTLRIPLRGERMNAKLQVEPVSGRFAISPVSSWSKLCAAALNRIKDLSAPEVLGRLKWWLTSEIHAVIKHHAGQDSWRSAPVYTVPRQVLQSICVANDEPTIYLPWPSVDQWMIIVTANPNGFVNWWVYQSDQQYHYRIYPSEEVATSSHRVPSLPTDGFCTHLRTSLSSELGSSAVSNRLRQRGYPVVQSQGNLAASSSSPGIAPASAATKSPIVWTKMSSFVPTQRKQANGDILGIQFIKLEPETQSQSRSSASALYLVRGYTPKLCSLFSSLAKSSIKSCAFADDGKYMFRIRARVGSDDLLLQIQDKLTSIDRLWDWSAILAERSMPVVSVDLSSIEFIYAKDVTVILEGSSGSDSAPMNGSSAEEKKKHDLGTRITLADGSDATQLNADFYPALVNPHNRIQGPLVSYLRESWQHTAHPRSSPVSADGDLNGVEPQRCALSNFLFALESTLGLMQAFDAIEMVNASGPTFAVLHTRRLSNFHISYMYPTVKFEISGRRGGAKSEFFWVVSCPKPRTAPGSHPSGAAKAAEPEIHGVIKAYFKQVVSDNKGALSLPTGVAVSIAQVKNVLIGLDKLMRANAPSVEEVASIHAAAITAASTAATAKPSTGSSRAGAKGGAGAGASGAGSGTGGGGAGPNTTPSKSKGANVSPVKSKASTSAAERKASTSAATAAAAAAAAASGGKLNGSTTGSAPAAGSKATGPSNKPVANGVPGTASTASASAAQSGRSASGAQAAQGQKRKVPPENANVIQID